MHLTAGDTLGPYEIRSLIGTGGMGTVYKARDVRLGRTVATKYSTRGGGRNPKFRRDGKDLYYLGGNRKMTAVQVNTGATFQSGTPVPLFDTRITNEFVRYAVSADDQDFLFPLRVESWTARLK